MKLALAFILGSSFTTAQPLPVAAQSQAQNGEAQLVKIRDLNKHYLRTIKRKSAPLVLKKTPRRLLA